MAKNYIQPTLAFLLKRYLLLFLPLAFALSAIVYGICHQEIRQQREILVRDQSLHLQAARDGLGRVLDDVVSDLRFLAGSTEILEWIESGTAEAGASVAREFEGFARLKRNYGEVRLLGAEGAEPVAVGRASPGDGAAAPLESPLFESGRLYPGMELVPEEIYVSPLAPGQYDGSGAIRFAKPLFRDGELRGMVTLSYLRSALEKALWRGFHFFHGELHLFGVEGHLMGMPVAHAPGERTAFGPAPGDWLDKMDQCDNGQFELAGGLFSFVTIRPWEQLAHVAGVKVNSGAPAPPWKLVSFIPRRELDEAGAAFLSKVLPLYAAGLTALAVGTFLLVGIWLRLRLERDYSGRLIESSPALIVGWNSEGQTLFVNGTVERITGYGSDDLVGRNWWQVFYGSGEQKEVLRLFREMKKGPLRDYEMPITTRSGETRRILWNTVFRYDEHGRLTELVGFGNDVTERRRAENMRAEFVAMVSHELRTPLTSIRGALGLLTASEGALAGKDRELLRIARNNTDQLVHLIDDILDVQRIESGKLGFSARCMELPSLLERSLEAIRTYALQLGATVELSHVPNGTRIRADDRRFGQVMNNLLSNAAKFSPDDKPVVVHVERKGEWIRIGVSDCGPGIPEHYRPHVFEKFTQADTSNTRRRGSGLGLYISKCLVEGMEGRIGFETETGFGTLFYFDLPACD